MTADGLDKRVSLVCCIGLSALSPHLAEIAYRKAFPPARGSVPVLEYNVPGDLSALRNACFMRYVKQYLQLAFFPLPEYLNYLKLWSHYFTEKERVTLIPVLCVNAHHENAFPAWAWSSC